MAGSVAPGVTVVRGSFFVIYLVFFGVGVGVIFLVPYLQERKSSGPQCTFSMCALSEHTSSTAQTPLLGGMRGRATADNTCYFSNAGVFFFFYAGAVLHWGDLFRVMGGRGLMSSNIFCRVLRGVSGIFSQIVFAASSARDPCASSVFYGMCEV